MGLITDYQDLEIWSWRLGGFYLENGLDFTWLAAATLKVAKAFGYMYKYKPFKAYIYT
jgi:hypothetical protein